MKKIINTPETVVSNMCNGLVKAHKNLVFDERWRVVRKKEINENKVTLISGGGSGHEPAHAGFIGKGMLDCAVCGDVFASPSIMKIYNGILQTKSNKGTLLIVKNYSGDCMNFNEAAYYANDDHPEMKIEKVYVNDDIAVKDSLYTVGRRGVAGTVLVHKIAGAAAEEGLDLQEVKRLANKTIENVRSIGFALTSCTVPAKGTPTFQLAEDEIEFGVGIHGEPGVERQKLRSADNLAKDMIQMLLEDLKLKSNDEVVLLINGFGGTPLQELYILNNSASNELEKAGIKIYDTIVGNFMTSIDMAGASISVLKVDKELKKYYDMEVDTPAFKKR